MIIKVKAYKSLAAANRLFAYLMDDRRRMFNAENRSFVLTQNLKGQSAFEWVSELKRNEAIRTHKRAITTKITQEIIAFHRGDAKYLTLRKMQKIAREYMRMRSPNSVYVAVPHFDKDGPHIHIVVSGLEYRTGKSLRMTRLEFEKIKKNIQAFQLDHYPELSRSVVRHGRGKKDQITDKEYQVKLRTGKETVRERVKARVGHCIKDASSEEEVVSRLIAAGIESYHRGGKLTGVIFDKKKYRLSLLGINIARTRGVENLVTRYPLNKKHERATRMR